LAEYRNVPDADLLEQRGVFVAEGRLVVGRLLASGRLVTRSVMVTERARVAMEDVLAGLEVPVFVVPQAAMNQIAGYNIHRGCLAIGERPAAHDWRRLAAPARRLLVAERVGDADNVGSLFRNAAAFAVDAVLLGPACASPLYRKAIRTSMAAALAIPFAHAEPWPEALRELAAMGVAVVGLTPAAGVMAVRDVIGDARGQATAFVIGHEGDGLSAEALAACSHRARIPMAAGVDSINVATAAAIALYELNEVNERAAAR
jgi:tRNA G18 (ribose-2'-O)-methylase SpoU